MTAESAAAAQRFGSREGVVAEIGGRYVFLSHDLDAVRVRLTAGESPDAICAERPDLAPDAVYKLAGLVAAAGAPEPDSRRYFFKGLAAREWPRVPRSALWVVVVAVAAFAAWTVWAIQTDRVSLVDVSPAGMPRLLDDRLMAVWVAAIAGSVILHELGHLAVARIQGARVVGMRFKLAGFLPSVATNVTGVWTLPRGGRVLVALAGPVVSLAAFAALAVFGETASWLSRDARALVSAAAMVNYLMGVVALLPGFRLDGYFVLSHALNVPNLGRRAWEAAVAVVTRRGPFEPKLLAAGAAIVLVTVRILVFIADALVRSFQDDDVQAQVTIVTLLALLLGQPVYRRLRRHRAPRPTPAPDPAGSA